MSRPQHWTMTLVSAVSILIATSGFVRYVYSGLYWGVTNNNWGQLRTEELPPLLALVRQSISITEINPRQYGPMTFLLAHPLVAATSSDRELELLLLALANVCVWVALYLLNRRLFSSSPWQTRLVFLGLALGFTPLLYILGVKNVESWELLFIASSLYLHTHHNLRLQRLAGIPLALGALTKLMPAFLFLYLFSRDRVAAAIGLATAAGVLTLSQLLYGPLMGWMYPIQVAPALFGPSSWASTYWENNSLKGIVNKALAGFRLPQRAYSVEVAPEVAAVADAAVLALTLVIIGLAALLLWRWRPSPQLEQLRRFGGFGTVVALMIVLSPNTAYEYMILAIPAYAVLLRFGELGFIGRRAVVAAVASLLFVGNVIPNSFFVWVLAVGALNTALSAAPHLAPTEAYKFLGFPALGAWLLVVAAVSVQWGLVHLPSQGQSADDTSSLTPVPTGQVPSSVQIEGHKLPSDS